MASLKEQLKKIDIKKVKVSNGNILPNVLANEARRLYRLIQYKIDDYYNSYDPIVYNRTGDFRKSLYVEDIANIRVVGNSLVISMGFNQALSMHRNIFDGHNSFVPLLMEQGWYAKKLEKQYGMIERFTRFGGIHAIRDAIEEFNRSNKYGIVVNADDFYNTTVY